MNNIQIIQTDNTQALGNFREHHLSAENIHRIHTSNGAFTLINPPVGIGKSASIDASIPYFLNSGYVDLIVVLAPTHNLLQERKLLRENPDNIALRYMQRRPGANCGTSRNNQWETYEKQQMSLLAKEIICAHCPQQPGCAWPHQLGVSLRDAQVIFASQAYLNVMPSFIYHVQQSVGVKGCLVLLDEIDFSRAPLRRRIKARELENFTQVLKKVLKTIPCTARNVKAIESMLHITHSIKQCNKAQLIKANRKKIQLPPEIVLEIQKCGHNMFGQKFKYIGYDLELLARSSRKSWDFTDGNEISFCTRPWLGRNVIIYSSTASPGVLSHRLGHEVTAAFSGFRFKHSQARWYNIRASMGMSSYFNHNAEQIIYLFAQLIISRTNQGKRPLLICKKDFRDVCITQINAQFHRLEHPELYALKAQDWLDAPADIQNTAIPVLHYGIIGVNDFTDFDCAYCLMGYYLPTDVISDYFQELYPTNRQIPIKVESLKYPPYRMIIARDHQDSIYKDYLELGQKVLQQEELGTVMQTVGRVRPFTQPREIITFQCGSLSGITYDQEFISLEDMRKYFKIEAARKREEIKRHIQVQKLKSMGFTQLEVAKTMSISRRTVQRKWHDTTQKGVTNPI